MSSGIRTMIGPDLDFVRSILSYCPESGIFTWTRKSKSGRDWNGKPAGTIGGRYLKIRIRPFGLIQAHRLAWFYVHGKWPTNDIDHINGDGLDNRISNLRDVPRKINAQNRRVSHVPGKLLGVHKQRGTELYFAKITIDGKCKTIGSFQNESLAHQAYLSAKRELHEGCTI